MTETITTAANAIVKAGAGANATITADTTSLTLFINEGEAYLCNLVKYDLITNWTNLEAVFKLIFSEYVARYAAIQIISYDMSGYTSRIEGEDILNIHIYRMQIIEKILNDSSVKDFLGV